MSFKNHIQKCVIAQIHRAVGDDSKLTLSHSTKNTAQLLEMLKSSKDANKTMRSIQNLITDNKRNKEIGLSNTTLTLDSDKQKQILGQTRTKSYHRHGVRYKTKIQNFKTLKRPNSKKKDQTPKKRPNSKTNTQQGQQKLSKNRDGHKTHKTKEVLTRPNKKSDMSNKLATCDYVH